MSPRARLPNELFADETFTVTARHPSAETPANDDRWLAHEPEGQLSVDVYETPETVVIAAPIAGVKPDDLEVYLSRDIVTIRGARGGCEEQAERNFLFQECFWGRFSRSIILPCAVKTESAEALLKNGVLTIRLPKQDDERYIPVAAVDEEL
ncbi:Hsp20/alpha crystallin family protein [Candidatus Uhrbacteria bacterium]|nr:Hsp20/alpha crystallin family protein [Candidatus Uhrbacteria bacterium]